MRQLLAVLGFDRSGKKLSGAGEFQRQRQSQWPPDPNRFGLVQTGANRLGILCPVPTRRWAPPAEHAVAILEFLQGPGGRTGTFSVKEMKQVHGDVCDEWDIEQIGWTAVGRELRKLLGGDKTYAPDASGKSVRVYRIPPAVHVAHRRIKAA